MSRIPLALAAMLLGACAGAPKAPAASEPEPEPVAAAAATPDDEAETETVAEADEERAWSEDEETLAQAEGTQVLEIDAGDLGGSVDTITAEPTRPQLPSMMKDIRMGPSG